MQQSNSAPTLALVLLATLAPLARAQDFNGDGQSDLAAGAPYETLANLKQAGTVSVLYGDGDRQNLVQPATQWNGGPEAYANFGQALAWGDFDGDGFDDLAVAAPAASVNGIAAAGVVTFFRGSKFGLTHDKGDALTQDTFGVEDEAEASDGFGWSLASGDFNGDGISDLAVGAPFEDTDSIDASGCVHVLLGQVKVGLTGDGATYYRQGVGGLLDQREVWDFFGFELVAGDFRGDGYDDLAVGIPHEDVNKAVDAGAVQIIPFYGGKLDFDNQQFWTQDSPGIVDETEYADNFGWSLAAGDFHFPGLNQPDGADDLAIGVPGENPDKVEDAGAVHVLYGFPSKGLVHDFSTFLHQGMNGAWGEKLEVGDAFGYSLAAPVRGDGTASLAIGVPFEDVGSATDAGAVHVLTRLIQTFWFNIFDLSSITITQDSEYGGAEPSESGDRFGYTLANYGLPYDGDDFFVGYYENGNLAIGAPFEDLGKKAGQVGQVSHGLLLGDSYLGLYSWQDQLDPVETPEKGDRLGYGL
ncbi:FG-GAP repeat protein [Engelhardtia mirabilis]|uniref:FG-GAP repeat protein n=1 Tax=Engelhardtia mirabilis TaxID=2528011 RepID=A0A518BFW5_9BACT|nr:FG-GAP repeat protein [Planctomycetes bacterium Pla133]QDV00203.1 FG-GAP repeat protein [Planctomycetes bacterium Pla86]